MRELISARTDFDEFGGLVELLFQFRLVIWQSVKIKVFAKISSLNVINLRLIVRFIELFAVDCDHDLLKKRFIK